MDTVVTGLSTATMVPFVFIATYVGKGLILETPRWLRLITWVFSSTIGIGNIFSGLTVVKMHDAPLKRTGVLPFWVTNIFGGIDLLLGVVELVFALKFRNQYDKNFVTVVARITICLLLVTGALLLLAKMQVVLGNG